ncbi:MAG: class I SAM-dependent methyltransferase [Anaerolineales bacterium]|jgi:ubiquinone/menaquinone biosynthesis C-methylase UbiE|nr:class I SAM-dependent methyltransferase [Chloroflexota bacterium]MBK6646991.1 class I SAM-dependent methyltransferase [Anaerolineales bacterium]
MKIDYQEPSKDLLMRIDIHEKYGSANIDVWTNDLLKPQAGMSILDVGCGAGKLSFLFDDYTKGGAGITGGDFSNELLDKARARNKERGSKIDFQFLDFNEKFNFADNTFDLCTSAFAIYYASDLKFTFGEAHRVLKPGGRLFVSGPLPENKQMFYDIIKEATNAEIPPMPGSSRFKGDIFNTIDGIFAKTELHKFENHLTFPEVKPFIDYVRASLGEDRRLWTSMFNGPEEYEALIGRIEAVATRWFERDGKLVMTKVVGGILATK